MRAKYSAAYHKFVVRDLKYFFKLSWWKNNLYKYIYFTSVIECDVSSYLIHEKCFDSYNLKKITLAISHYARFQSWFLSLPFILTRTLLTLKHHFLATRELHKYHFPKPVLSVKQCDKKIPIKKKVFILLLSFSAPFTLRRRNNNCSGKKAY